MEVRERKVNGGWATLSYVPEPPSDEAAEDETPEDTFTPATPPAEEPKPGDTPAAKHRNPKPELLYLGWQNEEEDVGWQKLNETADTISWDIHGKLLSPSEVKTVRKKVGPLYLTRSREGSLPTLLLIFQVDETISQTVMPTVLGPGNLRRNSDSSKGLMYRNGMNLATVSPIESGLEKWPSKVDFEIHYAVEKGKVIKTITEVPDKPVDIADGVTWYLDPSRVNRRHVNKGQQHPLKKTAGVLQTRVDGDWKLTDYTASMYLKGRKRPVENALSTLTGDPNGPLYEKSVSDAFESKDDIKRIDFFRRRYEIAYLRQVPVRTDLLSPEQLQQGTRWELPQDSPVL